MNRSAEHPLLTIEGEYRRLLRAEQDRVSRLVRQGVLDAVKRGILRERYDAVLTKNGAAHRGRTSVANGLGPNAAGDLGVWAWLPFVDSEGNEVGLLSFQSPHKDRSSKNLHHIIGQLALIRTSEGDGTNGCTPISAKLPISTERGERELLELIVTWLNNLPPSDL